MNARTETLLFSAIAALFAFLTIGVPANLVWHDVTSAETAPQVQARDSSSGRAAAVVSSHNREIRTQG